MASDKSKKSTASEPASEATDKPIGPVVQEDQDNLIDDVKEELIEAKESLFKEIKGTAVGLLNSVFGDFNLFWAVIKTIVRWFIKPVSLNVRAVEKENMERAAQNLKPRHFTDFALMKSIFMLSLTFLVVEETATQATEDHWINQGIYFLFFVVLLFIFIGMMWLWKLLIGLKTGDARVFIGFLIYQYATIYVVSFIVNGPLGIDSFADDSENILLLTYFIPLIQSCYFLLRLMKHYQMSRARSIIGFMIGSVLIAFLLFLPPAVTHTFLIEGVE